MILLDTHAFIWWAAESDNLSRPARRAAGKAEALGVSIMTCWETAMLAAKRRITFNMDVEAWLRQAVQRPRVRLVPLNVRIVAQAAGLPDDLLTDPVDRILVATCREHGVELITRDERIGKSFLVKTVW